MADQTLAQVVRAKYPGTYDQLSDQELEAKVRATYPGVYDHVPTTPTTPTAPTKPLAFDPQELVTKAGKGLAEGFVDVVNPMSYIRAGQGILEGIKAMPAYVRGFTLEDVGRAKDALIATAQDPEAMGRIAGNIMGTKVIPGATLNGVNTAAHYVAEHPQVGRLGGGLAGMAAGGGFGGRFIGAGIGGLTVPPLAAKVAAVTDRLKAATQGAPEIIPSDVSTIPADLRGTYAELQKYNPDVAKRWLDQQLNPPPPKPVKPLPRLTSQAPAKPVETPPATSAPAATASVKPDTVKLFRGESETGTPGPNAGQYFTTNPLTAIGYAKRGGGVGRTLTIELPAEEAAKYFDPNGPEDGSHILPPEVAAKAQPIGGTVAVISQHPPGTTGPSGAPQRSSPGAGAPWRKNPPSAAPAVTTPPPPAAVPLTSDEGMAAAKALFEKAGVTPNRGELSWVSEWLQRGGTPAEVLSRALTARQRTP